MEQKRLEAIQQHLDNDPDGVCEQGLGLLIPLISDMSPKNKAILVFAGKTESWKRGLGSLEWDHENYTDGGSCVVCAALISCTSSVSAVNMFLDTAFEILADLKTSKKYDGWVFHMINLGILRAICQEDQLCGNNKNGQLFLELEKSVKILHTKAPPLQTLAGTQSSLLAGVVSGSYVGRKQLVKGVIRNLKHLTFEINNQQETGASQFLSNLMHKYFSKCLSMREKRELLVGS